MDGVGLLPAQCLLPSPATLTSEPPPPRPPPFLPKMPFLPDACLPGFWGTGSSKLRAASAARHCGRGGVEQARGTVAACACVWTACGER